MNTDIEYPTIISDEDFTIMLIELYKEIDSQIELMMTLPSDPIDSTNGC